MDKRLRIFGLLQVLQWHRLVRHVLESEILILRKWAMLSCRLLTTVQLLIRCKALIDEVFHVLTGLRCDASFVFQTWIVLNWAVRASQCLLLDYLAVPLQVIEVSLVLLFRKNFVGLRPVARLHIHLILIECIRLHHGRWIDCLIAILRFQCRDLGQIVQWLTLARIQTSLDEHLRRQIHLCHVPANTLLCWVIRSGKHLVIRRIHKQRVHRRILFCGHFASKKIIGIHLIQIRVVHFGATDHVRAGLKRLVGREKIWLKLSLRWPVDIMVVVFLLSEIMLAVADVRAVATAFMFILAIWLMIGMLIWFRSVWLTQEVGYKVPRIAIG